MRGQARDGGAIGTCTFINQFLMGGAVVSGWGGGAWTTMSNIPIAFLVLGAFFTLYIVAATWQSKDARSDIRSHSPKPKR